ncbi:MAG: CocE/NonD family hydrolase, partial [Sciscionella sp.]
MLGPLVDRLFGVSEPRATRLTVDRDIHIPMSDGTAALADHYRPAETAGAHPVVLIRTPYGHHTLFGRLLATAFARGGFQVVIQSVRGVFGSGGTASMFHQERSDGLDTVHWLRQQGWCDGRVAMAGASYLGYTQWALAPYVDPPLVAVGLGVTCADFPASFYPGGVIALDNLLSWSALITTQERRSPLGPLAQVGRARTLAAAMRTLPIADGDRAAVGEPVPFFQEVVSHSGVGDDFWSDIDHSSEVATLSAPASMVTGWYDLFLPWQLKDFAVLAEAG